MKTYKFHPWHTNLIAITHITEHNVEEKKNFSLYILIVITRERVIYAYCVVLVGGGVVVISFFVDVYFLSFSFSLQTPVVRHSYGNSVMQNENKNIETNMIHNRNGNRRMTKRGQWNVQRHLGVNCNCLKSWLTRWRRSFDS